MECNSIHYFSIILWQVFPWMTQLMWGQFMLIDWLCLSYEVFVKFLYQMDSTIRWSVFSGCLAELIVLHLTSVTPPFQTVDNGGANPLGHCLPEPTYLFFADINQLNCVLFYFLNISTVELDPLLPWLDIVNLNLTPEAPLSRYWIHRVWGKLGPHVWGLEAFVLVKKWK